MKYSCMSVPFVKERELQRIDVLTGNEVKKAKVNNFPVLLVCMYMYFSCH